MNHYICKTCGVEYAKTAEPPMNCIICDDERQYIPQNGQRWTSMQEMIRSRIYSNEIIQQEDNLWSITTKPEFAIGQSAYLLKTESLNVLWDCVTYLDDDTERRIRNLGGLDAIALSHPHYYSAQAEWAERFNVPLYIHEDDRSWVMRNTPHIVFWSGEVLPLTSEITLIRLGGHFKGGAVLHYRGGEREGGLLLSGDILTVTADRRHVSFMYSYPNYIPLPASTVKRMADVLKRYSFSALYQAFLRKVESEADFRVQKSAERYIAALEGTYFST
ncbi:MBL fold metallo-hydrolase [Fictibacillus iocasae]|uniref:MBL fold metallo-hydrolase n=1 Tax=Fictibacillus iocasae TaxID=2715437 RepID=A0ABW2NLV5_9BACL